MYRVTRILIPCDFSPSSEASLRHACDMATTSDAELHLLHVVSEPPILLGRSEPESERLLLARVGLDRLLDPQIFVNRTVVRDAVIGTPYREICRYAQQHDIDLIVMGTHGRSGLAHLAMGSVTEKVLHAAPCPVMIVKVGEPIVEFVRRATKLLKEQFTVSLAGEFTATRTSLKDLLTQRLEVSNQTAEQILERLITDGLLTWEETPQTDTSQPRMGSWRIGTSPVIEKPPMAPPLVTIVENSQAFDLVQRAVTLRATDVHIDPAGIEYSVRFRIDGRLERYCGLDPDVAGHLIQQFKTAARIDIAGPFQPKEGRLRMPEALSNLDVRITTSPVASGEAVALRIFDREHVFHPLNQLGLSERSLLAVDRMLRRGEGIVLVTGPTGSGKTTTVYSMLETLGNGSRNIVSIEDPVEFAVPFVRQMEVNERHGMTMTSGLRTLLRMDPDVVFIGEIRDTEAAEIGMRAASSGKYVISTLHTRDVPSTITAMLDLHIDNRSLAGNLTGIISQRIIRRLCLKCRRSEPTNDEQRRLFEQFEMQPPQELFQPAGCPDCRGRGYRGRIGVFEVVVAEDDITNRISGGATEHELRQMIRQSGTPDLTTDAMTKVRDGITDLSEALEMRWA